MKQLRIYTIAAKEAAAQYATVHWKRHEISLKKFGIQTQQVYMENTEKEETRVFAVVSYDGDNMELQDKRFMESEEFRKDMEGFALEQILHVEAIQLEQYL